MSSPHIAIVGGAGHVGLPLALVFASKGRRVLINDINNKALEIIKRGEMPFSDKGAPALLKKLLRSGNLSFSPHPSSVKGCAAVIVTTGTPIDEFANPKTEGLLKVFDELMPYLSSSQLVVLRSTVHPGTTGWVERRLHRKGVRPKLAFCPERLIEGRAIEELQRLPQIVSGTTRAAEDAAARLFSAIAPQVVRLTPLEAEFAKLFCNAYRYIHFAVSNQLYLIANTAGLDYYRILEGIQRHYPRMAGLPGAGFTAGPCLLKDTMQLSAFYRNQFTLGHTAMLINEGLPIYLLSQITGKYDVSRLTVGLLGMAFKAGSDDPRSSLSYKLKKELGFRGAKVLTTDPFVKGDPDLRPLSEVLAKSNLLILCAPHEVYRGLKLRGKRVIDVWNFFGRGGKV